MTSEEIASVIKELFDSASIQSLAPGSWQIETKDFRLLVLLSEDQSWLRILIPIVSAQAAQPFMEQLLEANFDETQEARYALHQGVVWGVFQHSSDLGKNAFSGAIARLLSLHHLGLSPLFEQLVESRIRQIILVAKKQGQSLEATLQNLDRFYEEGVIGEMEPGTSPEQALAAWRRQLERFWPEVEA